MDKIDLDSSSISTNHNEDSSLLLDIADQSSKDRISIPDLTETDVDDSACTGIDRTANDSRIVLENSAISVEDDSTVEDSVVSGSVLQVSESEANDALEKLEDTLEASIADFMSSTTNDVPLDEHVDDNDSELLESPTLDVDKDTDASIIDDDERELLESPTLDGDKETEESNILNDQALEDESELLKSATLDFHEETGASFIEDSLLDNPSASIIVEANINGGARTTNGHLPSLPLSLEASKLIEKPICVSDVPVIPISTSCDEQRAPKELLGDIVDPVPSIDDAAEQVANTNKTLASQIVDSMIENVDNSHSTHAQTEQDVVQDSDLNEMKTENFEQVGAQPIENIITNDSTMSNKAISIPAPNVDPKSTAAKDIKIPSDPEIIEGTESVTGKVSDSSANNDVEKELKEINEKTSESECVNDANGDPSEKDLPKLPIPASESIVEKETCKVAIELPTTACTEVNDTTEMDVTFNKAVVVFSPIETASLHQDVSPAKIEDTLALNLAEAETKIATNAVESVSEISAIDQTNKKDLTNTEPVKSTPIDVTSSEIVSTLAIETDEESDKCKTSNAMDQDEAPANESIVDSIEAATSDATSKEVSEDKQTPAQDEGSSAAKPTSVLSENETNPDAVPSNDASSLKRKLSSEDDETLPSDPVVCPGKESTTKSSATAISPNQEPMEKRVRIDNSDATESIATAVRDDDDDIVVVEQVTAKSPEDASISKLALKRTHSNVSLDSVKKQKIADKSTSNQGVSVAKTTPTIDLKPITLEPKPEGVTEKSSIPLDFLRYFKKSFSTMTRMDMEELFLQKVVEAIVNKSEIAELRQTVDEQESALTKFRTKIMELSKQFRDLEMVHLRVMKDLDANNGQIVTPVKITRAVGLQVMLPRKDQVLKAAHSQSNASSKTPVSVANKGPTPTAPAPRRPSSVLNQPVAAKTLQSVPNTSSQPSTSSQQQSPQPQPYVPQSTVSMQKIIEQQQAQQRAQQNAKKVADTRKLIQQEQQRQHQHQQAAAAKQLYQVQQKQLQQQQQQRMQIAQQNSEQRKIASSPQLPIGTQMIFAQRKSIGTVDTNGSTPKTLPTTPTPQLRVPPVILKKMVVPNQQRTVFGTPSGSPMSSNPPAAGPAYTIAVVPQSKLMQQSTPPTSSSGPNTIDLTDEEEHTREQQFRRIKPAPPKVPAKNTATTSNANQARPYPTSKAQVARLQKIIQKPANPSSRKLIKYSEIEPYSNLISSSLQQPIHPKRQSLCSNSNKLNSNSTKFPNP